MRPIDADELLTAFPVDDEPTLTKSCVRMTIKNMPTIEQAPQWIPCSERLPEEHGFYLVAVGSPYKHIRVYQFEPCTGYENENLWRGEDGSYCFNWFVKAWMPLPESWKGDKE